MQSQPVPQEPSAQEKPVENFDEQVRNRLQQVFPQSPQPTNNQLKKTNKDLTPVNLETRRLKLDPTQSYGMSVKRPGDESGTYHMQAAPTQVTEEDTRERGLRCGICGTRTEEVRLTCPSCGSYFNSSVQQTSFEKQKQAKSGRQTVTGFHAVQEELSCQQMMMKRVIAKAIDLALQGTVIGIIAFSYMNYVNKVLVESPDYAPLFLNIAYCVLPPIAIIFMLAYSAFFESSPVMATPGKIVTGLTVTDSEGKTLTFMSALGRSFATISPLVLLVVSLWFIKLLNPALNSLNNATLIETTQVLGIVGFFGLSVYVVSLGWMASNSKRQTLGDVVTNTIVEVK